MNSTTKRTWVATIAIFLASVIICPVSAATTFTYQGRLVQGGAAVTAVVDVQLALFDTATVGTQIGTTQTIPNVQVTGGLFTISVDFGSGAFDGTPRWLEIAVASPQGSPYVTLAPRQELTAAPTSTFSLKPWESALGKTWYPGGIVGIGLATPATPLALLGNGGNKPVGLTQNQIGGSTLELTTTDAANQQPTRLLFRGGTDNARVEFYSGARGSEAETMRISSAGEVGIATADPLDSVGYAGGWGGLHISEIATTLHRGMMCIEGANIARLHLRNNAAATNEKDFAITNDGTGVFSWLNANLGIRHTVMNCDVQGDVAMGVATGDGKLTITNTSNASALNVESIVLPPGTAAPLVGIQVDAAGQTCVDATTTTSTGTAVEGTAFGWGKAVEGYWFDSVPGATGWAGDFVGRAYFETLGIGREQAANDLEVEGQASKTTQGGWAQNSDARIKTDVCAISDALDALEQVRLVDYAYTDSYRSAHPEVPNRRYMGVIAQEFACVFPDYVRTGSDTLPSGEPILQVDTYPLDVYTAVAMQELGKEVTCREAENRRLRQRLNGLIERLNKLEKAHTGT